MADAKSDYLEAKILDHVLGTAPFTMPSNIYVSLHTASVTDTAGGAEVTGGSYARQQATFNAASTNGGVTTATNDGAISWTNLPAVTITYVGLWDAATNGNLLYWGPLGQARSLAAGDPFTIQDEQMVITEG